MTQAASPAQPRRPQSSPRAWAPASCSGHCLLGLGNWDGFCEVVSTILPQHSPDPFFPLSGPQIPSFLQGWQATAPGRSTHSQTAAPRSLWKRSRRLWLPAPQTPPQIPRRRHRRNEAPQTRAPTGRTLRAPPSIPSPRRGAQPCAPFRKGQRGSS